MTLPPLKFPYLQKSLPLSLLFAVSLAAVLSAFVALAATLPSLPSEIPLLPAADAALVGKGYLLFIPAIALLFLLANAFFAERLLRRNEPAAASFTTFINTFVSILLAASLFRFVKLYPTAALPFEEEFYPLLFPFIITTLLGLIATVAAVYAARRFKLFDKPHGPYSLTRAIPRLGAIPLYFTFVTAVLVLLPLDKRLLALLIGGGIITLVQSIDDVRPLPFWVQGTGHLLAGLALVAGGIGIEYVRNPLHPWIGEPLLFLNQWELSIAWQGIACHITVIADLLTLAWIFALVNVVDWLDGLDGLASGVGIVAGVAIVAISFIAGTPITALLGAILVGALTGFLPFNFFPAKIYLGGGAFLLGYLLAALSIFSGAKTGTALLVLALPIIDAFYVIYRRIRKGQSPFVGDTTHLHHRLLEKGLSQPQIVLLEWGIVTLLAVAAVILTGFYKLLGLAVVLIGGLLANKLLLRQSEKAISNRG